MRRRALLAASSNLQGGFKANFYYDYCEEFWGIKTCSRGPDDLGIACYNEGGKLLDEHGISDGEYTMLPNPINYGFEVYIEGSLVYKIAQSQLGGTPGLEAYYGEEGYAVIYSDGSISYSY